MCAGVNNYLLKSFDLSFQSATIVDLTYFSALDKARNHKVFLLYSMACVYPWIHSFTCTSRRKFWNNLVSLCTSSHKLNHYGMYSVGVLLFWMIKSSKQEAIHMGRWLVNVLKIHYHVRNTVFESWYISLICKQCLRLNKDKTRPCRYRQFPFPR